MKRYLKALGIVVSIVGSFFLLVGAILWSLAHYFLVTIGAIAALLIAFAAYVVMTEFVS